MSFVQWLSERLTVLGVLSLVLGLVFFVGVPGAVEGAELFKETFESGGGYTPVDSEFTDGGQDYWCRLKLNLSNPDCFDVNGNNIGDIDGISASDFNNIQGDFVYGGEDLDGEGQALPLKFTMNGIDISGTKNLKLSALAATNSSVDWDSAEFMKIQYDVDSSGSWTDALCYADDGSDAALDSDCDGVGDGRVLSDTFTADTVSIGTTGDSIDLRVLYSFDAGSERGFFDNIRITGDQSGDDGSFLLNPGIDVALDGRQTWTLTYEAGKSSWDSGTLQFDVPDAWGNPQITDGSSDNFTTVTVQNGTIADSRILGGDTIEIDVETLATDGQVDVLYGDDSRTNDGYANAPSSSGSYTFTALIDTDGNNPQEMQFPDETLTVASPDNMSITPSSNPKSFIGIDYDITIGLTGGGNDLYGGIVEGSIRGGDGSDSELSRVAGADYLPDGNNRTDTGLTQSDGEAEFNFTTATRIETDVIDFVDTSGSPSVVHRDSLRNPFPVISEIGWDSTEEFFELYNPTLRTQDLTNWWVSDENGNTEIDTSVFDNLGSIGPHQYLVIERSEDAVEGQSDQIYSSMSFEDGGETLFLMNSNNVQVDEHSAGSGWHAGVDGDHISMERKFAVQTGELERSWANADSTAIYADAPTQGEGSPGFPNATSLHESRIWVNERYTNSDTVDVMLQILVNPGDTQPDIPTQFVTDTSGHSVQTQPGITTEDGYSTGVLTANNNGGTSIVNIKLPVIADSTAISDTVVFDYTSPDSDSISLLSPEDGLDTRVRNIDFDWRTVNDTLSGVSHYRLQVSRGSSFNDLVVNDTFVDSIADPAATDTLSDSTYWWRVRAVDRAGNQTPFSRSDTFSVDGTPPQDFTLISPEEGAETNVLTVAFDWNGSSDTLSNIDNYTFRTDTGTSFTDPLVFEGDTVATDTEFTYSEEDQIVWTVIARDNAGNTVSASDSTFVIDQTAPSVDSGTLSVSDGTDTAFLRGLDGDSVLANNESHRYTVSVTGATDVLVYYSTDGSLATTSDSSFTLTNSVSDTWVGSLPSDQFTAGDSVNFIVEATDTATNSVVSDSAGNRYRYQILDNVLPTVDLTFPDTGAYVGGSDVSGTYVLADPDNDPGTVTVEVSDDSGATWDTEATISGEVSSVSSSSSGDTHSFSWDSLTDLGTVEDTRVKLRIRAFDGTDTGGWDTSPAFTVDNVVPVAETISSTADINPPDTGVSVFWNPTSTDVAFYSIYRSEKTEDTSGASRIDTTPVRSDTTSYLDSNVTQGDSYFYYVTTVDTAGNQSDSSNVASAPYVSLSKTTDEDSPNRPGDTVTYRIPFLNEGFAPAGEVAVYDAIPDSMTLADTASVIDTPAGISSIDIEYKRNGTWESSSFPRDTVTQVRWIIPGAAASEESVQPVDPATTDYSGRVRFATTVD